MDGFLDTRRRKDDRALDKDEEEYFNEDRLVNF
jgi:protein phosphatase-4 regulatory subunit 3